MHIPESPTGRKKANALASRPPAVAPTLKPPKRPATVAALNMTATIVDSNPQKVECPACPKKFLATHIWGHLLKGICRGPFQMIFGRDFGTFRGRRE